MKCLDFKVDIYRGAAGAEIFSRTGAPGQFLSPDMDIEKQHYSLLAAICASLFSMPLMLAGVNAILPEIGRSLDAGATLLSLAGTIYALGLAIFQLACGTLGDIWGHKRIFLVGGAIFGLAGAVIALVDSISVFLAMRFMQGVGAAMTGASGLALLASGAAPEKRAAYLGASGAAVYAGIACGPPVAGFITGLLGWRWVFVANTLLCAAFFLLMKYGVSHDWRPAARQKFDWTGCLLYGLAMLALTASSSVLSSHPVEGWICLGGFLILILAFYWRQLHVPFPMLDLKLIAKNKVLWLSALAAFVNYASFFGIIFYFSFYLQLGRGMSVQTAGLFLAVQAVVQALCTPVAARLCKIWRQGVVSALGAALCGSGLAAAAFITLQSSYVIFLVAQILLGAGCSFFALANTAILLESGGKGFIGQASGLTGAVRTGGQLCSMIVVTLTLSFLLNNEPAQLSNMPQLMQGMRFNTIFFACLNLGAVGICLARNRQ